MIPDFMETAEKVCAETMWFSAHLYTRETYVNFQTLMKEIAAYAHKPEVSLVVITPLMEGDVVYHRRPWHKIEAIYVSGEKKLIADCSFLNMLQEEFRMLFLPEESEKINYICDDNVRGNKYYQKGQSCCWAQCNRDENDLSTECGHRVIWKEEVMFCPHCKKRVYVETYA